MKAQSLAPTFRGNRKCSLANVSSSVLIPLIFSLPEMPLLSRVLGNNPLSLPLESLRELAFIVSVVVLHYYTFVSCISVLLISPLNFDFPKRSYICLFDF